MFIYVIFYSIVIFRAVHFFITSTLATKSGIFKIARKLKCKKQENVDNAVKNTTFY